jgi:hypothetical protein
MQSSTFYVSNTNNTYGWQAYPATQRSAFICEVRGCSSSFISQDVCGLVALMVLKRGHLLKQRSQQPGRLQPAVQHSL